MATSAVSCAITTIGKLLTDEAKYLWGVEDEVERLQTELSWMQCFLRLKDADVRQADDERLRMWVADIRELAYDAENLVESFALKIKSKREGGFLKVVKRSACILKEGWLLHETRLKIEKVLARIVDLTRRLQTYGIKELADVNRSNASKVRRELRRPYPHIEDDNVVGLTDEIAAVVTLLIKDCDCRVVSICGMGGLGKTTLAKKVFNRIDVRKEFVQFGWVYVSQQFHRRKVWEQILAGFNVMNDDVRQKTDEDVAKILSDFLKERKCLVILDDVWNNRDWNLLSPAFPSKDSNSKILLTSRSKDLAEASNDGRNCYLFELKVLNEDDSWELFQKIAFRNICEDSSDYSKLEDLGKGMIKRCGGLPLAIVVVGGILTKYPSNEWEKVSEHVESFLKRDKDQEIENVLALSYEDLPSQIKSCFLYLSHFPEDYEIPVDKLIQLWIAEGFVSLEHDDEENGEVADDIAESYLVELVERFMIQVEKRDSTLKIKTCRMHDLMRDLCLSRAKQENFLHIIHPSSYKNLSPRVTRTIRRIVVDGCPPQCINKGSIYLRSILFFGDPFQKVEVNVSPQTVKCVRRLPAIIRTIMPRAIVFYKLQRSWAYILNNFKLIRVLNFDGHHDQLARDWLPDGFKLPCNIGNFIHLRFLGLRGLEFAWTMLPSSLGDLKCLLTLDLRIEDGPIYVPNVIWKLAQLRHLYLPRQCFNRKVKLALHTLTKLQTLVNFSKMFCCAADLSQLTSLRKLKMRGPFTIEKDFNKDSDNNPLIITSKHIRSLHLSLYSEGFIEPTDLALFLSSCSTVCELSLKNVKIAKLPDHHHFSSDIAYIHLELMGLEEDPMPTLEKLPNLRILSFNYNSFIGKEMACSAHGFPKLDSLSLRGLENLEEWKVDEGAMPALRCLSIMNCKKLKKLPDGLRSITNLQELKITSMPQEFQDKIVEEGFQHIPSITFNAIISLMR